MASADLNGELVNGTGDDHFENDGDRRPSLNASTPDDDLSLRERTSTVPIPPARPIGQVCIDQSSAAQSQPDLLGLPYTSHQSAHMRKRNMDTSLIVSPEVSSEHNSRLSMPPFVFSYSSLRSFENSPSTSSSYANDMALRLGGNEDENAGENSDIDDDAEQAGSSVNSELANCAQNNSIGSTTENAAFVPNSEVEDNSVGATSDVPDTSTNLHTVLNEVNTEDVVEFCDVDANTINTSEHNASASRPQTSAEPDNREAVLHEVEVVINEGNDDNVNVLVKNEAASENMSAECNTNGSSLASFPESFVENSIAIQQETEIPPSNENTSTLSLQQVSQHEVFSVALPPEEHSSQVDDSTVTELSTPDNIVDEGSSSQSDLVRSDIQTNSGISLNESTVNNCNRIICDQQNSNLQHLHGRPERPDENHTIENSVQQASLSRLESGITGNSLMDFESEPDIMNFLPLSSTTPSDMMMPTQSADVEGTSPRRTTGICNLRTLFQIPERDNFNEIPGNAVEGLQQNSEEVSTPLVELSEISSTTQRVDTIGNHENSDSNNPEIRTLGNRENRVSSLDSSGLGRDNLVADGAVNISNRLPSSNSSAEENASSIELLSDAVNNELESRGILGTPLGNRQVATGQASTEDLSSSGTEDEASRNVTTENAPTVHSGLISQSPLDGDAASPRMTSPIPSITHVQYLRSRNISMRLPSRTASHFPVVHVVPPNVPVTRRNSENNLPSIEAEPVLPSTLVESAAGQSSAVATTSLAMDIFDAVDGSREAINAGPSTSHSGASPSEQTSSTSIAPNSEPKRKVSSGNSMNSRKLKPREAGSRHLLNKRGESSVHVHSRRRAREDRANRNRHDNVANVTNEESIPSHRPDSIYGQISDFATDENVPDQPLPLRK